VTNVTASTASHGKGGNKDESKDNENNNNPKEDTLPHSDYGVNGETGELVNMSELGIWEPLSVKVHAIQTAIENACMILRIDDIVADSKSKKEDK
jgi:chaperonin GroEL (HSP60 family)